CARNCPVNAISGEKKKAHKIDQDKCELCGICAEKCRFAAIHPKPKTLVGSAK
ncbi:MAG: 4Fe-4S binding protein, partial [Planctomycetes bacterium]|nr:4Fe-4S binding protein [Planctomycetota bacterium]